MFFGYILSELQALLWHLLVDKGSLIQLCEKVNLRVLIFFVFRIFICHSFAVHIIPI